MPISASTPLARISTFRNFNSGLPFGGNFHNSRFVTAEGPFNPAMVIKWLPLKDMSKPQPVKYNEYDEVLFNIKSNLKRGDHVTALSMGDSGDKSMHVHGMIHEIRADRENQRVRIFVHDFEKQNIVEVHPESIYRDNDGISESVEYVKSFGEF